MILLMLFVVIFLVGLGFWYYNRRQTQTLSETIIDKDAVITALKQHYIGEENLNDTWHGGGAFTYETTEISTSKPASAAPTSKKAKKTRATKAQSAPVKSNRGSKRVTSK